MQEFNLVGLLPCPHGFSIYTDHVVFLQPGPRALSDLLFGKEGSKPKPQRKPTQRQGTSSRGAASSKGPVTGQAAAAEGGQCPMRNFPGAKASTLCIQHFQSLLHWAVHYRHTLNCHYCCCHDHCNCLSSVVLRADLSLCKVVFVHGS